MLEYVKCIFELNGFLNVPKMSCSLKTPTAEQHLTQWFIFLSYFLYRKIQICLLLNLKFDFPKTVITELFDILYNFKKQIGALMTTPFHF